MTSRDSIVRFLNKELKVRKIPDTSRNGLQVKSRKIINKVGFAVDATLSTFKKAKRLGVDFLIVHHGIKWKGQKDFTGIKKERIRFAQKSGINIYVCHLPLDIHNKYGNSIQLAKILDLVDVKKFGRYHGVTVGYRGRFKKALSPNEIARLLNRKIKSKCVVLGYGPTKIKTIGIVSGSGSSVLPEVYKLDLDCLLTGDAPYYVYNDAKDRRQNVILAGHYATETVGVKALMPAIREKFDVKTIFIDDPVSA